MLPSSRPQLTQVAALDILTSRSSLFPKSREAWPVVVLGIRGYYLDSMGKKGKNDRGIYDDAIFIITPTTFQTFNANVDASLFRDKVAVLESEQFVEYRIGMHRANTPSGHLALRQSSPVIVRRDDYIKPSGYVDSNWGISLGNGRWTDRNWKGGIFAINLHCGGNTTTSSLGCQTIPPKQWPSFLTTIQSELERHKTKSVAYILIDDPRIK